MQQNRWLPAFVAVLGLSLLTACGGGDGGDARVSPDRDTGPVIASSPDEVLGAARGILTDLLSTVDPNAAHVAAWTGAEVTEIASTFDGTDVTATLTRDGASTVTLDSADAYEQPDVLPSFVNLPGRSARIFGVFDRGTDGAVLGRLVVDWADDDPGDYLAGGYWLRAGTDPTAFDVGVFVHGPELSLGDTPSLPISGSATYQGMSAGVYAVEYGVDAPALGIPAGSQELGGFTATATLTADFSAGTIEGCEVDSVVDFRLRLRSASFDRSAGTFGGTGVVLDHSYLPIAQSSGVWSGRFSNRADSDGNPRLAAGAFIGRGASARGTRAGFAGAFAAGNQ